MIVWGTGSCLTLSEVWSAMSKAPLSTSLYVVPPFPLLSPGASGDAGDGACAVSLLPLLPPPRAAVALLSAVADRGIALPPPLGESPLVLWRLSRSSGWAGKGYIRCLGFVWGGGSGQELVAILEDKTRATPLGVTQAKKILQKAWATTTDKNYWPTPGLHAPLRSPPTQQRQHKPLPPAPRGGQQQAQPPPKTTSSAPCAPLLPPIPIPILMLEWAACFPRCG